MLRSLVRASAFWVKEVPAVFRQPRQVLTLVLGPFVLMLLVGFGYRNEARDLRALFVVPEGSEVSSIVEEYATTLSQDLDFRGTTLDEVAALASLQQRQVDVVVVVPPEAEEGLRGNTRVDLKVYHNEVDPFQATYVSYVAQRYVAEVNRRVLIQLAERSQGEAATVQGDIEAARVAARTMREALDRGDEATARREQGVLSQRIDALQAALGVGLGSASESTGALDGGTEARLASLRENTDALDRTAGTTSSYAEEARRLEQIESDLTQLQERLAEFSNVSSAVLVSPFGVETVGVAPVEPRVIDYFAPSVLALLLQHLAITFGALSIVSERQLGTVELFRVSPLSAGEALFGKYTAYMLFAGILGTILVALMVSGLGVPMLGSWLWFFIVILTLIFTSLGIGFVISLIATNDSHAVQLAMLTLLASVFFSGIFLALFLLWEPVRVVSWSLPATYGMNMLQSVMLRGEPPQPVLLFGLAAIGVGLALLAWSLMRRLFAQR